MARILARSLCFKLIFEFEFQKEKNEITLEEFLNSSDLEEKDKDYIKTVYDGVIAHQDEILSIIQSNLKDYTVSRIYKTDLAILTLAIYEIKFLKDNPSKVIINEAVELSKKYSTDKSYSFVNGILASVVKEEEN